MWQQISNAPIWLFRGFFFVIGLIDGLGVALLIAVFFYSGPAVEVTVKNEPLGRGEVPPPTAMQSSGSPNHLAAEIDMFTGFVSNSLERKS